LVRIRSWLSEQAQPQGSEKELPESLDETE